MSLRRLLNVTYTVLAELFGGGVEITQGREKFEMPFEEWLNEPVETEEKRLRRRRANANRVAQSALVGAFGAAARR